MHLYMAGVLAVTWALWFWDTYLDFRQFRVIRNTEKPPTILRDKINNETFGKAKSYSHDKAQFGFFTSIFSLIQSTLMICLYLLPYFWDLSQRVMIERFGLTKTDSIEWEIFQSLVFTFITSLVSTLIGLPISIYNTFYLEQKHGFNKQTAGFYAWDKLKMFLVSFSISAPVLSGVIYIVRKGGDHFFLYLWLFCFAVMLVLTLFHGEIAALFDKFTPLPECELKERIEKLAKEVKFPLTNIFVVEGSKRSSHSNAYQSGLFNKKRIVIYDTLIADYPKNKDAGGESVKESEVRTDTKSAEQATADAAGEKEKKGCTDDEIIAVLCHEIGHWWHMHLIKNLIVSQINLFLIFLLFSKFYKDATLYSAFGFQEKPVVIGLALLMQILSPYFEIVGFLTTLMSRKFEYQSDMFASKKGHAEQLKTALIKLNIDNLGFPVHDELYSTFNHSHPTLIQRIQALDRSKTE